MYCYEGIPLPLTSPERGCRVVSEVFENFLIRRENIEKGFKSYEKYWNQSSPGTLPSDASGECFCRCRTARSGPEGSGRSAVEMLSNEYWLLFCKTNGWNIKESLDDCAETRSSRKNFCVSESWKSLTFRRLASLRAYKSPNLERLVLIFTQFSYQDLNIGRKYNFWKPFSLIRSIF